MANSVGLAREARPTIPPLIRRNTLLLALSQAFTGAGMGLVYSIGPLMILAVSDSVALAGISVTLMGISRFVMAYPVGRLTDLYGRKPAMLAGLLSALVGAIGVGLATVWGSLPMLLTSLLVFGMGMNAAQQLRVAAADMYPPSRRAEGLGYVLSGSLVGVFVTPLLVSVGEFAAPRLQIDALGVPWLLLPLLIVPGLGFVLLIRPDPKQIAQHLGRYYPGELTTAPSEPSDSTHHGPRHFLAHEVRRRAMLVNLAAQANMAVVMVSSSLLLKHHGSSLSQIAASSALHSFGMWAFALPIGRLADRLGRRWVLLGGGIMATAGALIATETDDYWTITLGAFLVGVGWCAANVATTVVIADTTPAIARGRGVGFNDSLSAAANILVPLIAGPMGDLYGVPSTGLLAAAVMIVPLLLLLGLGEPRPGVYRSISEAAAVEMVGPRSSAGG